MTTINLNPTQNKVSALKNFFEQKIINQQKPAPRTKPVQLTQSQSIHTKQVERSEGAKNLKIEFDGFQFLIDNTETLGIQGIQLENVKKIQAHIKASKNRAVDEHNPELQKLVIAEFKEARGDFLEYVRSEASFEDLKDDYFGCYRGEDSVMYQEFKDVIEKNNEKLLREEAVKHFTKQFNALYKALESDQNFTTCKSELYYKKLTEYLNPGYISAYDVSNSIPSDNILDLQSPFRDIYNLYETVNYDPDKIKTFKQADTYQAIRIEEYKKGRPVQIHVYSKDPDFPFSVFNYALASGCTLSGVTVGNPYADNSKRISRTFLEHDYTHAEIIEDFFKEIGKIMNPEDLSYEERKELKRKYLPLAQIKAMQESFSNLLRITSSYILSLPKNEQKQALLFFHLGYFLLTHEASNIANLRDSYFSQDYDRVLKTMKELAIRKGDSYTLFETNIKKGDSFDFFSIDTAYVYLDVLEELGLKHGVDKKSYLDENGNYEDIFTFNPEGRNRIPRTPELGKKADADYQKILDCFMEVFHHMGRIATEAVASA